MGGGGHQLGNHVRLGIGKVQRPAYVPDGAPGGHGAKGGDLGHMVGAILAHDVLNDLRPPLLTEIRIEIRHTHPFRVQKPLENQGVLHGVYFRDVHTVGRDGAGTGATAWADRDPLLLGIADKIPDNQVVVDITHGADDADLILQAVFIFLGLLGIPLLKALIAKLPEIALVGIARGHREGRQVVLVEGKFQVAPIGDLHRIFKGLREPRKQDAKLFLAFDVEFLGLEFHPVLVVHGFARLDAKKHILHFGVFLAQIVGIVGDDHGKPRLPGQPLNALVYRALLINAVILKLQEKVSLAENVGQFQGVFLGPLVVLPHQALGDGTGKAGGQGNQPLVVLLQQGQVYSGLAVKAMDKGLGNQIAQVFIALPVLAQQHQMIGVVVLAVNPVGHAPAGNVDLAADDGLDARGLGSFIKIDTAVHDPVVGDGHGGLPDLLHPIHQAVDPAGTVQQAVLRMQMQVDKTHGLASFARSVSFFIRLFMAGLVMGGSIMAASSERDAEGFSSRATAA